MACVVLLPPLRFALRLLLCYADSGLGACPPHFEQVAQAAGCSNNTSGRTPFGFVTFRRCTPTSLGMGLYPRFRVCLPAQCNPVRGRGRIQLGGEG
jgi:hypothetical protein